MIHPVQTDLPPFTALFDCQSVAFIWHFWSFCTLRCNPNILHTMFFCFFVQNHCVLMNTDCNNVSKELVKEIMDLLGSHFLMKSVRLTEQASYLFCFTLQGQPLKKRKKFLNWYSISPFWKKVGQNCKNHCFIRLCWSGKFFC